MFSSFKSRKEVICHTIALIVSVGFLFVSEYSHSIDFNLFGYHVHINNPFLLESIDYWNHHTLASFCWAISDAPLLIILAWIGAKGVASWNVGIVKFVASLVIDYAICCCCYAFRNPSNYNEELNTIIGISILIAILQVVVYKYRAPLHRFFGKLILSFRFRR